MDWLSVLISCVFWLALLGMGMQLHKIIKRGL